MEEKVCGVGRLERFIIGEEKGELLPRAPKQILSKYA